MHPYQNLPERAFWKTAVSAREARAISGLWEPKFPLHRDTRIVTVGSCFAQHIGRRLAAAGYHWCDFEPGPELPDDQRSRYGYGVFSCRTGNVYTAAQLRQWLEWALQRSPVPAEFWRSGERWLDPFRPRLEPEGFASRDELLAVREQTLGALRRAATEAEVWVFTLGLTEAWRHRAAGYSYASCPGTAGGEFDPAMHAFHNFDASEVKEDLRAILALLRSQRPDVKLLLTVSPVPLTATASGQHVLVATGYSKAVLRAAAGELAQAEDAVDYFPSYEIITSPPFRAAFFERNMRNVAPEGVGLVMEHFFGTAGTGAGPTPTAAADEVADPECDEALLQAFAPK